MVNSCPPVSTVRSIFIRFFYKYTFRIKSLKHGCMPCSPISPICVGTRVNSQWLSPLFLSFYMKKNVCKRTIDRHIDASFFYVHPGRKIVGAIRGGFRIPKTLMVERDINLLSYFLFTRTIAFLSSRLQSVIISHITSLAEEYCFFRIR